MNLCRRQRPFALGRAGHADWSHWYTHQTPPKSNIDDATKPINMATFHTYDPSTRAQQSQPKACEACYARKVRCNVDGQNESCRNCLAHGVECRARTRKRKADQASISGASRQPPHPSELRRQSTSASARDPANGLPFHPAHSHLPLDDKDVSAPLLFIGPQNPLAASPGTTANAQSSSHDEFHNASFMTRSAILGDDFPNIDHNNAEQPVRQHKLNETELQVLRLYHAFDLPELPLRQSLLEAFTERCWTWMPVANVQSLGSSSPDSESSLLLLQAVLLVGSLMRPDTVNKPTLNSYYQRVKALVNSGYERNPLNILASLCLIQWYTPSAPRDISTDTARFWEGCALGIAQQIGLHQQPDRNRQDYGLRRRIWWTLFIRDSLMATAHGRPRMISMDDCTMLQPSTDDFDDPTDIRAKIFVNYQEITCILYDLCNFLLKKKPPPDERSQIAQRLLNFCRNLPDCLRLQDSDGWQRPYNLDVAQLHAPLLTTISIFYRPRSVFAISPENAASIAASNLNFRLLQAIHIREQTRYLASPFSFYGLVAAIPHLSSLRVAGLRTEADVALDVIESFMETLGTVRPASANNVRNVRAIRKAINSKDHADAKAIRPPDTVHDQASLNAAAEMLGLLYGPVATVNLQNITNILSTSVTEVAPQAVSDVQPNHALHQTHQQQQHHQTPIPQPNVAHHPNHIPPLPTPVAATNSVHSQTSPPIEHTQHTNTLGPPLPPGQGPISTLSLHQVYSHPDLNGMSVNGSIFGGDGNGGGVVGMPGNAGNTQGHIADFGEGFSPIMTSHFQENTWMRNWIDDLQLFPE